jgi:hypothetical protein
MTRMTRAWGALAPEQRIAAVAAIALLVTMFFPWYELQSLNRKTGAISSRSISAFGDVSFVEAAVFLVAAGVTVLLFARAERRDFHMPGSDGTIVMIAGGWATLLIFYRVFSRPAGHGYPVGIQWGFFLAFVASGALTYAGWRMRANSAPEPPLVRARRARRPPTIDEEETEDVSTVDEDVTVVARTSTRTEEQGTPAIPTSTERGDPKAPSPTPSSPRSPARLRPRFPPTPSEQLSFEDPPMERDER